MKRKLLSTFTTVAASALFSTTILACSSMGPATHAGKILSIDVEKSTFTILDAETVAPITFNAGKEIMQQITDATGMAMVDYTDDGVTLTATSIQIQ